MNITIVISLIIYEWKRSLPSFIDFVHFIHSFMCQMFRCSYIYTFPLFSTEFIFRSDEAKKPKKSRSCDLYQWPANKYPCFHLSDHHRKMNNYYPRFLECVCWLVGRVVKNATRLRNQNFISASSIPQQPSMSIWKLKMFPRIFCRRPILRLRFVILRRRRHQNRVETTRITSTTTICPFVSINFLEFKSTHYIRHSGYKI